MLGPQIRERFETKISGRCRWWIQKSLRVPLLEKLSVPWCQPKLMPVAERLAYRVVIDWLAKKRGQFIYYSTGNLLSNKVARRFLSATRSNQILRVSVAKAACHKIKRENVVYSSLAYYRTYNVLFRQSDWSRYSRTSKGSNLHVLHSKHKMKIMCLRSDYRRSDPQ